MLTWFVTPASPSFVWTAARNLTKLIVFAGACEGCICLLINLLVFARIKLGVERLNSRFGQDSSLTKGEPHCHIR